MKRFSFLSVVLFSVLVAPAQLFASQAITRALRPFESKAFGQRVSITKVHGDTLKEMLTDYAERVKGYERGEYKLIQRMTSKQIPEADDGQNVIGLARIVDVAYLISDQSGQDREDAEVQKRQKATLDLLFKVRELGGLIGVESDSWGTCGVSFPGVIVVDPKSHEVYSISPRDTTC